MFIKVILRTEIGNGKKLRFNEVAVYNEDQVYPLYAIEYRLNANGFAFDYSKVNPDRTLWQMFLPQ